MIRDHLQQELRKRASIASFWDERAAYGRLPVRLGSSYIVRRQVDRTFTRARMSVRGLAYLHCNVPSLHSREERGKWERKPEFLLHFMQNTHLRGLCT